MASEKLEMEYETKIAELNEQISWLEDRIECLKNQAIKKRRRNAMVSWLQRSNLHGFWGKEKWQVKIG